MNSYELILLDTAKEIRAKVGELRLVAKEKDNGFLQHECGGMLSKLIFAITIFEEDGALAYRSDGKTLNAEYLVEMCCKTISQMAELTRLE